MQGSIQSVKRKFRWATEWYSLDMIDIICERRQLARINERPDIGSISSYWAYSNLIDIRGFEMEFTYFYDQQDEQIALLEYWIQGSEPSSVVLTLYDGVVNSVEEWLIRDAVVVGTERYNDYLTVRLKYRAAGYHCFMQER